LNIDGEGDDEEGKRERREEGERGEAKGRGGEKERKRGEVAVRVSGDCTRHSQGTPTTRTTKSQSTDKRALPGRAAATGDGRLTFGMQRGPVGGGVVTRMSGDEGGGKEEDDGGS
jgi:hypothetical protein